MGKRVVHLVRGRMLDYIELDDGYAVARTSPPRASCGLSLRDSRPQPRYGVTVVGVKRANEEFNHATPDTVIDRNDLIIVAGTQLKVERFSELPSASPSPSGRLRPRWAATPKSQRCSKHLTPSMRATFAAARRAQSSRPLEAAESGATDQSPGGPDWVAIAAPTWSASAHAT
jgi:TrkA-C domain